MNNNHVPVMLTEVLSFIPKDKKINLIDATFGGGGHSTEILNNLNSSGRLIAFDQDQDAIENKIQIVEAGAQGHHKIQRGYIATSTYSAHYIQNDSFDKAVRGFVEMEAKEINKTTI